MSDRNAPTLLVLCDTVDRAGGTESYLSRVLPALRDRGLEVRVLARRVVDADAFGLPATQIAWATDDEPANASAADAIRDVVRTWRPDAVLTSNVHDAEAMAAARTARTLIVRVHDHRLFCPQGDRQYPHFPALCTRAMTAPTCLSNAVVRGCIAGVSPKSIRLVRSRLRLQAVALRADRFIVSSQFMADLCTLNGVSQQQLTLLTPPFAGEIARVPRPSRDRVLFAGRLVRDKGLASLVRALGAIAPERRPALAVAGAPTRESRSLPALAVRLGVDMTLLGKLTTANLTAEIDASTIVAVPSLWPEPFGLMGIEAFARARPVVAYDVGGIPEWMGDAGLLVSRGDERAFARAVETVLEPARWAAFADAAVDRATRYRVDTHAAAIAALVDRARAVPSSEPLPYN